MTKSKAIPRTSTAFTLLELLVVLVIVGALATLAGNAILSAAATSRQTACASNLRQIGAAIMLYAAENDGRLPATSHGGKRSESWIYTVAPYLDDIDKARICPADPNAQRRLEEQGTSYTLNSIVFNPAYDADGNSLTRFNRLSLIPKPSQTLLAFVVSDQKFGISADHTHSETWSSWGSVLVDIAPDRHRRGGAASDRTKGKSNYLYADGSVATIAATDFKRSLDNGINPALPPE